MIRKNAYAFLLFFITAGLLVSLYALKQHYAPIGGGACNVNATFNCDLVNRGPYGEIFGFPVAGLGVIGYVMMGILAMHFSRTKDPVIGKALLAMLAGGIAFSMYLTYLEAFVIDAWCLVCLASLSCIVGASATGHATYWQFAHPKAAPKS
ncbi:MAG TPA: vitamin K epoxide reductase family protein [Candidatus Baltobacteraceae bacterium]|nr:vitamin K epoxide reductase family protein [Candidatus Baltobacteraceae bacterium]